MTTYIIEDRAGHGFTTTANLLDSVKSNIPQKRTLRMLDYGRVSANVYWITVDSIHNEVQQLKGIIGFLGRKTFKGSYRKQK